MFDSTKSILKSVLDDITDAESVVTNLSEKVAALECDVAELNYLTGRNREFLREASKLIEKYI